MSVYRTFGLAIGLALASVSLTACAADSAAPESTETTAPAVFNGEDVVFAQMMIPHHEQALEMSEMILAADGIDPAVATLAQQIYDAQQPEITQLTDWLTEWGQPVSVEMHHEMDGMLSEEDLAALDAASGVEASRMFLTQMIDHHVGAVEMAQVAVDGGENPDVKVLAQSIVDSQNEEIQEMRDLLVTLS